MIATKFKVALFFFLWTSIAVSQIEVPKLQQRVTDFTNTLSYVEWNSLDRELRQFEDTTSNQIVVVMVPSLNGESIDDYAVRLFEQNKIGVTKKNNGVLLVIAKDDHEMRIEVGYGLEGALTDAISSQIIRREIAPHFRNGNYYAGIVGGINAIMSATAGEYHADNRGKEVPPASVGLLVIFLAVLFFIVLPSMRSARRYSVGSFGSSYYSGWGLGGGGFGGFSGGGFFGGGGGGGGWSGGGGMSGGGGASGSW